MAAAGKTPGRVPDLRRANARQRVGLLRRNRTRTTRPFRIIPPLEPARGGAARFRNTRTNLPRAARPDSCAWGRMAEKEIFRVVRAAHQRALDVGELRHQSGAQVCAQPERKSVERCLHVLRGSKRALTAAPRNR